MFAECLLMYAECSFFKYFQSQSARVSVSENVDQE